MSVLRLCCGCDANLGALTAYCASCDVVMPTYEYRPNEREAYAYERMSVVEKVKAFTPGRSACFDGDLVSPGVAAELIQLGRAA